MSNTTFVENRAGDSGPAVVSFGLVSGMSNTTFGTNTHYCPSGQYGYDIEQGDMDEQQIEVRMV